MKKSFVIVFFLFICYAGQAQTYHSGTISVSETWLAANNPHICTGDITISSASLPILTLEPGVIVKFNAGVGMYVGHPSSSSYKGGIIAVGTESEPILFTSNSPEPQPGDWGSIQFRRYCLDDSYQLENVILEYGGSASSYALLIEYHAVSIKNVTFRKNLGSGIKINNFTAGSARPIIQHSKFIENTGFPLIINANDLMALGSGNSYVSNGTNEIYVNGGTISNSQAWLNQGIPFFINNDITVSTNGGVILTITDGSVLKFEAQKALRIGHASVSSYWGTLNATGVEFAGTVNNAGHWYGFIFNTYSQGGTISGCTIKNAGFSTGLQRTIHINTHHDMTQQTIIGCQIINGFGTGLHISSNSRPAISNNTISGHSGYPIIIDANDVMTIGTGNTYAGNGTNEIYVNGGSITDTQTWLNPGIPFYINNDLTLSANGGVTLTIQYNSLLKFEAQKALRIGHASVSSYWGTLNATGVEFTGTADNAGHWYGFIFNTYSQGGTLSGCTIKNAGFSTGSRRTIFINTRYDMTQQTITGCQIINGLGTGVYISNNSRPQISGSIISGHSEYPLSIFVNDVGWIGSNNNFSGNNNNIVEVRSGTISESQVWKNHNIPYFLTDSVLLYSTSSPHLHIMPGCIIQLNQASVLQVGHISSSSYKGSLNAEDVLFTRASEGISHSGIYFTPYAVNEHCILTDCTIEYGGEGTNNAGIRINQSAPVLEHVTFRNNQGDGLRIDDITEGDPLPIVNNCRFYNNAEYPIRIYASELSCLKEDNVYSGNNPDKIQVTGDGINYNAEWINQGIPYDIFGTITLYAAASPHLTIHSGIVLMFDAGNELVIGHATISSYQGSLQATGVTFTGKTNTAGDWGGIKFNRISNFENTILDRCTIEYASINILCSNSSPFIKQCVIANAQQYGIHATGSLTASQIFGSSIYNNNIGIYCTSSANPLIGGETGNANSILNNTSFGIQNTSSAVMLNATHNWWGDVTGPYHLVNNEFGLGNPVSDFVDFSDFLTTPLSEAPSLFDLFSPQSEVTIWSFDTVLDWETSIDPTPEDEVKYRLELSTTYTFSEPTTFVINDIEDSQFLLNDNVIEDDTRYWWRVIAYDLSGLETNCNQQNWFFDVYIIEPPDYFSLVIPNHQATVSETSVLLTWEDATDPDPGDFIFYTVYLDVTASFSQPDSVVTLENGVYTPFCQPDLLYYWTVKATDTFGKSTFSEVRSFYVGSSAKPRRPSWLEISQNGTDITLVWEAIPGADSYIIEKSNLSPFSGFQFYETSITNNFSDYDAQNQQKTFYQIKAVDNDLVLYWRNLAGKRLN